MCLAIPARVEQLVGEDSAIVNLGGMRKEVSLALVDEVAVGDPEEASAHDRGAGRIEGRERVEPHTATDGKPSMITENGRTYRDAWGLNPFIAAKTLVEVRRCRNMGVSINTFMLDRRPYLKDFVGQITRINKGRAFFTTPWGMHMQIITRIVTTPF